MSQLEDGLRTALVDAPTPPTAIGDPLADLERRLGRARLRLGGIAVAVVVVLTAAIVVPLTVLGSSAAKDRATVGFSTLWPGPASNGVVSGDGYVWTYSSTTKPVATYVQQRNPKTGAVEHQYQVPATQPTGIFFGGGLVWVANGGDGPLAAVTLAALNPTDGSIATAKLGKNNVVVEDMAFIGSGAYVLAGDQVFTVTRNSAGASSATGGQGPGLAVAKVPQHVNASWVLATPQPNPNTWIIAGSGGVEGIGTTANGPDPLRYHYRRAWTPLASAGGADVWAASGKSLVLDVPAEWQGLSPDPARAQSDRPL